MSGRPARVAMLWRGPRGTDPQETRNYERLRPIADALTAAAIGVEPVLYDEASQDRAQDRLASCDGVLVWVDPVDGGRTRAALDVSLGEVASAGVWVSAHPDTIECMGTKEVLHRTRALGWGTDTDLYRTALDFRDRFPNSLGRGSRVLKLDRGNGGLGVWRVTLIDGPPDRRVRVQHAAPRDETTEEVGLSELMDRFDGHFAVAGTVVDQPFIAGVAQGMVRAYLVGGAVVGFARQEPAEGATTVLGLPSAKAMHDLDEPSYAELRRRLEDDWVPSLLDAVELAEDGLPVLWDADFLPGSSGFVLCEINVSSVLPYPPGAPAAVAAAVRRRLAD